MAKRFKIDEFVIEFGEYYPQEKHEVDPQYWFRIFDYKVYDGEKLILRGEFKTPSDLEKSDKYIPFFKTDIPKLEKEFVEKHCPEAQVEISRMTAIKGSYDKAFKAYFDSHPLLYSWEDFRDEKLRKDAVAWCEDYGIEYVIIE